jgi:hypothetical protein
MTDIFFAILLYIVLPASLFNLVLRDVIKVRWIRWMTSGLIGGVVFSIFFSAGVHKTNDLYLFFNIGLASAVMCTGILSCSKKTLISSLGSFGIGLWIILAIINDARGLAPIFGIESGNPITNTLIHTIFILIVSGLFYNLNKHINFLMIK